MSSQDLLTCRRDSLANSLDYSVNNSITIRAMLMYSWDSTENMLVKRSATDMRTVTSTDCLANPVNQYGLATIQATIQMHLMHQMVRNLDRRESFRWLQSNFYNSLFFVDHRIGTFHESFDEYKN